ncbi:MAG: 30S ribosomal protein S7, partial [Elusimicrobiaceae bacterium]|nr:30S ribosomal protein S7 [Elusimicrobiaceae bacterium]
PELGMPSTTSPSRTSSGPNMRARSTTLFRSMRWLIGAAQSRKGRPMAEKLAEEIILGSKKEGTAFKKREDVHKMAEANRAFAHFKW